MAVTINSNIASLNAQRRLQDSTSALSRSFAKLSSGLRINHASDDAAGLAISFLIKSDVRVYTQGVRNLNDGVSLLNIADGALDQLMNITIRLEELSEQAANGTLGGAQRSTIDKEAQALRKEFTRIAQTTQFNGMVLFDGTNGTLRIQSGYGDSGSQTISTGGVMGTGTLSAAVVYGHAARANSVTLTDMNGDGRADLVAAELTQVGIAFGNGDGSFAAYSAYAGSSSSAAVGDFNSDGAIDVVSSSGTNISVFLNNGNGTLRAAANSVAGPDVRTIAVGDVNGDGKNDIVVNSDYVAGTMSVMLGRGDGTFTTGTAYAAGGGPVDLKLVDLNSDGNLDMVIGRNGPDAAVLLGNGNGSFRASQQVAIAADSYATAIGDVNGDGVLDLVTTNRAGGTVSLFAGNGDGTFRAGNAYQSDATPRGVTLADLDGDGSLDVITANETGATISVLLNNGNGTLRAKSDMVALGGPRGITTGDINGDGVSDIVAANYGGAQWGASVFIGNTRVGVAPLLQFSLRTRDGAREALELMKQKVSQIGQQRGTIGVHMSRLGTAVSVGAQSKQELSAAESRIADVDVSEESANLVRNNILQQAGAAILAQANQQPSLALRLLQNV